MGTSSGDQPSRAQWLRRLATRRRDRVAIVLSGGGPLGALQVGALKALFEDGVKPDIVAGTSVGALNAAFVAFNPTLDGILRMERVWRNLGEHDLFPGGRFRASWARMFVRGNRVFENSGLRRLVTSTLGPHVRIEDAAIPLGIVCTDMETGDERVFTSGEAVDPILASTAMPGVFPPVSIDGRMYLDGGIANNVPIAPAVELGASTLWVLNSTSHKAQRRPLIRPMDYFFHAFTLARSQRFGLDLQHYGGKVKLNVVPPVELDFFVPFASMDHTDRLIDMSYEHTKRFLAGTPEVGPTGSLEAMRPAK
ncbi:MAG TPA: patatin-like phospholipase family protein [Actinomycetota bacterium]|nr:patatin-like phospholipase family protein [Actinomycetota bacterium]